MKRAVGLSLLQQRSDPLLLPVGTIHECPVRNFRVGHREHRIGRPEQMKLTAFVICGECNGEVCLKRGAHTGRSYGGNWVMTV